MRRIFELIFIWLLILAIVILVLSIGRFGKKQQRRIAFLLCIAIPALSSVREIGLDIPNYERIYSLYLYPFFSNGFDGVSSFFSGSFEPLNYIIAGVLGPDGFRLYLYIATQFTFLIVYLLIKERDNPLLYLAPFMLFNLFFIDQTRQFFGEGFILLSMPIKNGLLALCVALCSGLAHLGLLPAAVMTVFKSVKFSQVRILFFGFVVAITAFIVSQFFELSSLRDASGFLSSRLNSYSTGSLYYSTSIIRVINAFFPAVSAILFFAFNPKIFDVTADDRVLYASRNNMICAIIVFIASLIVFRNDVIATRLFTSLAVGNFLLIGNYLEKSGSRKVVIGTLLWLVLVNFVWSSYYFYLFVV